MRAVRTFFQGGQVSNFNKERNDFPCGPYIQDLAFVCSLPVRNLNFGYFEEIWSISNCMARIFLKKPQTQKAYFSNFNACLRMKTPNTPLNLLYPVSTVQPTLDLTGETLMSFLSLKP